MFRYPLRDIAGSLAGAPDLESGLEALLLYLRALQPDWHPSVAMYSAEHERFEVVFQLDKKNLHRRAVSVGVDQLPARLVRKFIQPSAIFNGDARRQLLEKLFGQSPGYEPDNFEGEQLQALTAPVGWRSCAVLPLNDRDELLGFILLVSPRPNAFGPNALEALQPLRGLASLAIARRLHAGGRATPESRANVEASKRAVQAAQERVRELEAALERAIAESEARGATVQALMRQVEQLRTESVTHHDESVRLNRQTAALEEQIGAIGTHLSEACALIATTEARAADMSETLTIVREAFEVIACDPDPAQITRAFVTWFCDRFQIERLTVMRLDDQAGDLRIMAGRGVDPAVLQRVRVPMGQGVAGWVARNQQPVLVREGDTSPAVRATGCDSYNSGSFISVPLLHRQRVVGVLNLSNKQHGETFDDLDLDRATLASNVLAMALGEARAA